MKLKLITQGIDMEIEVITAQLAALLSEEKGMLFFFSICTYVACVAELKE